jgi:hypothetical protein
MGDGGGGGRLVYISEVALQQIRDASRKENCSIRKFIEEGLVGIMRAYEMGYPPRKLIDVLDVLQIHKDLGGILAPRAIFAEILKIKMDDQEKENLLEKWYDSGRWHGTRLSRASDDPISLFKLFLDSMGWNLNEVEVEEYGKKMKLVCVSSVITAEETEILSRFISGALCGMEYTIEKEDIMTGMIILDCVRGGTNNQSLKNE